MSAPKPSTKKFGSGERTVPHSSEKASKYYPAEDERQSKKVCSLFTSNA
jgi:large subunit ribosomal protein L6e